MFTIYGIANSLLISILLYPYLHSALDVCNHLSRLLDMAKHDIYHAYDQLYIQVTTIVMKLMKTTSVDLLTALKKITHLKFSTE